MILFCSDLDNTLIYSYKHDIGPDKDCVEIYQDREVSYMTPDWIEGLKRVQKKTIFVPVTTRTIAQYERINMGIEVPEYALVCNGGVLLRKGVADDDWYQGSMELAADAQEALYKAQELLETDPDRCLEVRFLERLFVFTKSNQPCRTIAYLKEQLDLDKVDVFSNGIKVYVVPKKLDKGTGVLRLKERIFADRVISAGDSEFDIPMLLSSDMGLCPEGLLSGAYENIRQLPQAHFTEVMLSEVEKLVQP